MTMGSARLARLAAALSFAGMLCLGHAALQPAPPGSAQSPPAPDKFLHAIGGWADAGGVFERPNAVAAAADGRVFVADTANYRVQVFGPTGEHLDVWGGLGNGDGQFNLPQGLAVGSDGDVFVADTANHRVQRLAADGSFLAAWGRRGAGPGEFSGPYAIAVRPAGPGGPETVYVSDSFNHRVQYFTVGGAWLGAWGGFGSADGAFSGPDGVAVAGDGTVYVADAGNARVQRFTGDGRFVAVWDGADGGGEPFAQPSGIAVAPDGTVFVSDLKRRRVSRHTAEGTFIGAWGTGGASEGQFDAPAGLSIGPAGDVYVADGGNHRVHRFTAGGTLLYPIGGGVASRRLGRLGSVAVAADHTLYVVDHGNHQIVRIAPDGRITARWGGFGTAPRMFRNPAAIALAADGSLVVADTDNGRLQKIDAASGAFIAELRAGGGRPSDPPVAPTDVAVAPDGTLWVLARDADLTVRHLGADGSLLAAWGPQGFTDREIDRPAGLVLHGDGSLYLVDQRNKLKRFDATGAPLGNWFCECGGPYGLRAGPDGTLFLLDASNRWVLRFDPAQGMRKIAQVGGYGMEQRHLLAPRGIAVAPDGTLFVVEWSDSTPVVHRVKRFRDWPMNFLGQWQEPAAQAIGKLRGPKGVAVGNGTVYVSDTGNGRVLRFTPDGQLVGQWRWNFGNDERPFDRPEGIDVGPDGRVFLAHTGQGLIHWFAPDGTEIDGTPWDALTAPADVAATRSAGFFLVDADREVVVWWREAPFVRLRLGDALTRRPRAGPIGDPPAPQAPLQSSDGLLDARALALDPDGESVLVADTGHHRVVEVAPGGAVRQTWGRRGPEPGSFIAPAGIDVGADGTVYVGDTGNDRLQRFDAGGRLLGAWGERGSLEGQLDEPRGVAVDAGGRVYVADGGNHRVVVFGPAYPDAWRVELFANPFLAEQPLVVTRTAGIDFAWGAAAPGAGLPADSYSARAARHADLPAGGYRFSVNAGGGARLWIDGHLVLDRWSATGVAEDALVELEGGDHALRLDYVKRESDGKLRLSWEPAVVPSRTPTPLASETATGRAPGTATPTPTVRVTPSELPPVTPPFTETATPRVPPTARPNVVYLPSTSRD